MISEEIVMKSLTLLVLNIQFSCRDATCRVRIVGGSAFLPNIFVNIIPNAIVRQECRTSYLDNVK